MGVVIHFGGVLGPIKIYSPADFTIVKSKRRG